MDVEFQSGRFGSGDTVAGGLGSVFVLAVHCAEAGRGRGERIGPGGLLKVEKDLPILTFFP